MLNMFKGLNCYKSVKIVFNFVFYNVQIIGPKTIVLWQILFKVFFDFP